MKKKKKKKKSVGRYFLHFLNAYLAKTQLIKVSNFLDSSRPYVRLLEISKTRGSRELFLSENDFKTCSAKNVPKNIQILEAWKPINTIKSRLDFFQTAFHK